MNHFIDKGIIPVCFINADVDEHYEKIISDYYDAENKIEVDILPFAEAVTRYPDYELVVTDKYNFFDIYKLLLEQGIAKERFFKYSTPKWCSLIGTYFVIHGPGINTCCEKNCIILSSKGNFLNDFEQYNHFCQQLINALKEGFFTPCKDCHKLLDGNGNVEAKINTVNISSGLPGGDYCNFKCSYCTYEENIDKYEYDENILDIFEQIMETIHPKFISYNCGEITVSSYKNEIFSLWKDNNCEGKISTNASVYNQDFADLLAEDKVFLNCSIDAGTKETYAQIKGVDCFNKVLGNLERYAETGGRIQLKYILLKGINDNYGNIRNFMMFVKKINAELIISRDTNVWNLPMSENEYNALVILINFCRELKIKFSILTSNFPLDLQRMKADNFLD